MSRNRLIEVALEDTRWSDDATWAGYGDWDLRQVADDEAQRLRAQTLSGLLTTDDLRAGVRWANALDKEAVDMYGSDLSQGEQQAERTARRIMHIAGRTALMGLKNNRKRFIAQVFGK